MIHAVTITKTIVLQIVSFILGNHEFCEPDSINSKQIAKKMIILSWINDVFENLLKIIVFNVAQFHICLISVSE